MSGKGSSRLGDFFENRREKGRAGLPLMSVTMSKGLVEREDLERKQDTSLAPEDHLLVKPGDIAYNMMRMWQGEFGLASHECVVSPAYVVLRAKSGISPSYASYLFETSRVRNLFRAYSHGLTDGRLRLYFSDFCKVPAWIPGSEQQGAVVSKLSVWDRAIELTEALLKNTRQMKLALVRRAMRLHDANGSVGPDEAKLAVPAATNQACAAILLNDHQHPDFFFHLLSSQYQSIRALAKGGAQKNLSASLIKEILVPVLPLHEQQRIAKELGQWDESIRLTEQLLLRTRQQRAAVMRRLIPHGYPR